MGLSTQFPSLGQKGSLGGEGGDKRDKTLSFRVNPTPHPTGDEGQKGHFI